MARLLRYFKKMADRQHILVAIDDFPMTQHLEECLQKLVEDQNAVTIHLFHALGPLPPQLLESRGTEDSTDEKKVEAEQIQQQESCLFAHGKKPNLSCKPQQPGCEIFCLTPRFNLILSCCISAKIWSPKFLKRHRTMVVQRLSSATNPTPWLREQFHAHTAVQLKSASPDVRVCAVNV
jgi:hypothetical protein